MPSGHTHDAVTWFFVTPVALSAWGLTHDAAATGLATISFIFAGIMFSGDLDLPSSQYRRWGWLRWVWKPYQWVVPHRSVLSHGLLAGPVVRLFYLLLVAAACFIGVTHWLTGRWEFPWVGVEHATAAALQLDARGWLYVACCFAGMWLGAASHSLADWGWSAMRRRR